MTPIQSDAQLRKILQDAINANGVHIPLSQRSEKGLEHFKATNGTLFTTLTLSADLTTISTKTNIRSKAPLVELDKSQVLLLEETRDQEIEPTAESVLKFFDTTLIAFRTAYRP